MSRDSMEVLTEFFDDRIFEGLWPTRLPDLSNQDFFLWGYLKNVTFRNNLHTFDELKSNILNAISDINSHAHRKVSICHNKIMFDPSPFVNPTPLAQADTSRDVLPRGGTSQGLQRH
ncbi:uncharacterized protein TNCV_1840371 [Trichonephila clavipes]|nr:uncharacterized protein TNCV_1840371 [Trichonephila clavipes]